MKHQIKIRFLVEVEPDVGGYHAWCPAFKGLHVQGNTEEEAILAAKEGAIAYINSLMRHGEPLPVGCDVDIPRKPLISRIREAFAPTPRAIEAEVSCAA